ncbi:MAG TPA: hypothetical protein DCE42_24145 [Myxococcales bacterium]|nr:hypothetical protein [Deltaproteobacteria bacterium]MBU53666.1 hypothetical protein [Deltaproteobacteria bacterium]HAA57878.1 hypothetical protein [Myxococcales bacterium]
MCADTRRCSNHKREGMSCTIERHHITWSEHSGRCLRRWTEEGEGEVLRHGRKHEPMVGWEDGYGTTSFVTPYLLPQGD